MCDGLVYIIDLLHWYKIREKLYLQRKDEVPSPDFVRAVVDLYSRIFEFQARMLCFLHRGSAMRGVRGTLKLDDWEGMTTQAQKSDRRCLEFCALEDRSEERRLHEEESSYMSRSLTLQQDVLETLKTSQVKTDRHHLEKEEAELLQALSSDYESDKDLVSTRVNGTCEWFFEDERFLTWRDTDSSRLLWVSAGPGCGKSVLSRALIDERKVCTDTKASKVCYFFFKDGQEHRTRGADALCALLHQLFENTTLIKYGIPSYKNHGEGLCGRFSELWKILIEAAEDPEAGEIICILDALDECEEAARKPFMEKLVHFFSKEPRCQNPSLRLKFLITSRPYDNLEWNFERLSGATSYVRFDGSDKSQEIGEDINLVIDTKIPGLTRYFDNKAREVIATRLKSMENRTYLWLYLIMDIIENSQSKYQKMSSLESLLSELPPSISDAYERILSRSTDEVKARILLQLIVAATRPLTLVEANVALTVSTTKGCTTESALDLWPLKTFKNTVQNMCGLFLTVYSGKLFLIHQTAREFLIDNSEPGQKWKGCSNLQMANGSMSNICLEYLNLEDIGDSYNNDSDDDEEEDDDAEDVDEGEDDDEDEVVDKELRTQRIHTRVKQGFYLLDYAAYNWATHYASSRLGRCADDLRKAKRLCDRSAPRPEHWFRYYCKSSYMDPSGWTNLMIACELRLLDVAEEILNEGADINAKSDSNYGSALGVAASNGDNTMVQMLLNQGAHVNIQDGDDDDAHITALCIASWEGHVQTVQILLNNGANVNAEDEPYGNALTAAASNGNFQIVQLLLDRGAHVNAEGGVFGNALATAAFNDRFQVVQLLLDRGAHVNAKSGEYGSALASAAHDGNIQIVQLLLDRGGDVNLQDDVFGTALQAASVKGHAQVVQMLLEKGADVNARGGGYSSALRMAKVKGHEKVGRLLLDRGADVSAETDRYGSALRVAQISGHKKVVLDHGAEDIELRHR